MLIENNVAIVNPKNIADKFNEFFANVANNSRKIDALIYSQIYLYHANQTHELTFPFISSQVSNDGILLIINNLVCSKAADIYELSNFF